MRSDDAAHHDHPDPSRLRRVGWPIVVAACIAAAVISGCASGPRPVHYHAFNALDDGLVAAERLKEALADEAHDHALRVADTPEEYDDLMHVWTGPIRGAFVNARGALVTLRDALYAWAASDESGRWTSALPCVANALITVVRTLAEERVPVPPELLAGLTLIDGFVSTSCVDVRPTEPEPDPPEETTPEAEQPARVETPDAGVPAGVER